MMTKYIFVTGGVVSSLGKGITAASIGCLLKSAGINTTILKIDPYLNVDPGTMSPFQHGEVFVTDDGAETDLDLGYYERYLDQNLSQANNFTTGVVYDAIISRERRGDYLGKTVQVVPHVINEIKERIRKLESGHDVVITEIGGTVGDIEGLPFLEAARQLRIDVGRENILYLHVTLVPYIRAAEELKTKPTQQSVAKLREIGIEPQIIICRTERSLSQEMREKIALFCNVQKEAVLEERDETHSIYEVPLTLFEQGLVNLVGMHLRLPIRKCDLADWKDLVERISTSRDAVTIGVAGKYTELKDSYKSIWEALDHGAWVHHYQAKIQYVDVESKDLKKKLSAVDGILIPGGFGDRGVEGKKAAIRYAREHGVPFFGICLGMQCAVIEFAENVCGMKRANSTEFHPRTPYPVIDLLPEQKEVTEMGGTMRLGSYPCKLKRGSRASAAYRKHLIHERHRHRYELNDRYRKPLEQNGLRVTGEYEEKKLAEIVEFPDHPWFVGVQFHPEFKSRPNRPHPLFRDFIRAAIDFRTRRISPERKKRKKG